MEPGLSPSADTTFSLAGITLNCFLRNLKNFDEIAFMEAPVLNKVVVFSLPI